MDTVEMRAMAAYGCVVCGSNDVVATITIENRGVLAHYPSCATCIEQTVRRVTADVRTPGVVHHQSVKEIGQ